MTSAQVLRKQDHLEAGKRKLEKFWRKKAAEKAKKYDGPSARVAFVNGGDHLLAHHISSIQKIDTATSQSNYHVLDDYPSNKSDAEQDLSLGNSGTSAILATNIFTRDSVSTFMQDKLGYNGHEGNNETSSPYQESVLSASSIPNPAFGAGQNFTLFSDMGGRNLVVLLLIWGELTIYPSGTQIIYMLITILMPKSHQVMHHHLHLSVGGDPVHHFLTPFRSRVVLHHLLLCLDIKS